MIPEFPPELVFVVSNTPPMILSIGMFQSLIDSIIVLDPTSAVPDFISAISSNVSSPDNENKQHMIKG